uniref:Uncharacterized protein n=1 Tax=Leptocylindrus danicus TaxID=163516 RepID=A0A7S2KQQ2_9STRA|mmetsp:Transcript_25537/g.38114  ORF Transcript_25537/g.38114 Transcript_25537/m.38114 type:complete len:173 (+) Transcript_25537:119-637(+)|eukprot:CAMPEP_0116039426 /NCGR_PEP_ID=MMETSP0321-20121206/23555_1 /TAXON_ID=163516 /ORGANISM="Leptocylindrus danicus var. danicus, Strain B650" /LENGTH=172 /DNA_ID=CAMNT_0003518645 /DNA_START=64 /DNA_END=582 /DNA_ORIENTATION=+
MPRILSRNMPRRSSSRTSAQFWWANRSDVSLSNMVIHGTGSYGSQSNLLFKQGTANSSTAPSSVSSQEEFSDGHNLNATHCTTTMSNSKPSSGMLRSSKTRGDLTLCYKESDGTVGQEAATTKSSAKIPEEWGQFVDVTISEEEELLSGMQRGRFLVSPSRAKILRAQRLLR